VKQLLPIALILLTSCGALRDIPADGGLRQQLMEFATAAGDAAIRLKGTELLVKHAPELLPLIDKNLDRQVSLGELIDFIDRCEPAQVVMLGAIYFR
jgi:hypothetical protein